MTLSRASALISTLWLKKQLSQVPKQVKVLDTSWTANKSGKEDYLSKHIPGSQFFDLNHCIKPSPTIPRNPPDPACFTDYVQSLGINKDSHVIMYDRGGIVASARSWWTFRAYGHGNVSVLDGGLMKWESDGGETASGAEPEPERGNFIGSMKPELMKTFEDVVIDLASGNCQVLDGRKPEHFFGEEVEPSQFTVKALEGVNLPIPQKLHRGRIPSAKNLLGELVLDPETKCLLTKEELLKLFQQVGVDLQSPLTTMCYAGNAACLLALAAHVCDMPDAAVYYGSWTEWGQRASLDLVSGPGGDSGAIGG